MNKLKGVIKWAVVVVLFLAAAVYVGLNLFLNQGKPKYSGKKTLPGLKAEVTVYRDEWGIPHIYGETEEDVYMALGYIHAQERLFQMVLSKHMVSGRMAELFGDQPYHMDRIPIDDMQGLDRFNRVVGFKHFADVEVPKARGAARAPELEAYVAGINAFIKNTRSLPPEFFILDKAMNFKLEPWTDEDVIALGRYIGWFLSANWNAELFRLQCIQELGLERGWELMARHEHPGPYIIPPEDNPFFGTGRGKKIEKLYMPPGLGVDDIPQNMFTDLLRMSDRVKVSGMPWTWPYTSNNWAVSPERSESGHAILANDPHLSHMLPSIFFEAHLVARKDNLDVIGVTFPGMPFMVLGHNRHVAWAATTTRTDNQDLFIERVNPENPDQYWDPVKNGWRDFDVRTETIFVNEKGGKKKIELKVRTGRHGPILNDVLEGTLTKNAPPVALSWAGHTNKNGHLAFLAVSHAKSARDLMKILEGMDVPIQNWVFADTKGHIGFSAAGLMPIRPEGCDGTLPVRGDTTACDWLGWVPPDEQPRMLDPWQGYIVTANNKVIDEAEYPHVVSFNYPGYRAWRIEELLRSKQKLTAADMKRFQSDVWVRAAERLLPFYLAAYRKHGDKTDATLARAVKLLEDWDLRADLKSIASTIFHTAYENTVRLTYADDLPEAMYEHAIQEPHPLIVLDNAIVSGRLSFFDNRDTKDIKETRDRILAAALAGAVKDLEKTLGADMSAWEWGRVHVLKLAHPFNAAKPLNLFFPRFDVPTPGSANTVFNQPYAWTGAPAKGENKKVIFPVAHGPAWRHVIDMGDVPAATMILDTGQSGHIRSKHFFDQNPLWVKNEQIPMIMDEREIMKQSVAMLTLVPGKK